MNCAPWYSRSGHHGNVSVILHPISQAQCHVWVMSERKDGYPLSPHATQVLGVGTSLSGPADADDVAWSRTNEAYGMILDLTCSLFNHIYWCISKNAPCTQASNWAGLNKYREFVCSPLKVIATQSNTIANPLSITGPPQTARTVIDLVGPFSLNAVRTLVTQLNKLCRS